MGGIGSDWRALRMKDTHGPSRIGGEDKENENDSQ
jgi:hypothetical protein